MIRMISSCSVNTTTTTRPSSVSPMSRNRSSSVEWSGSGIEMDSGSPNAVSASANEMPCLRRFDAAFAGSREKRRPTCINVPRHLRRRLLCCSLSLQPLPQRAQQAHRLFCLQQQIELALVEEDVAAARAVVHLDAGALLLDELVAALGAAHPVQLAQLRRLLRLALGVELGALLRQGLLVLAVEVLFFLVVADLVVAHGTSFRGRDSSNPRQRVLGEAPRSLCYTPRRPPRAPHGRRSRLPRQEGAGHRPQRFHRPPPLPPPPRAGRRGRAGVAQDRSRRGGPGAPGRPRRSARGGARRGGG